LTPLTEAERRDVSQLMDAVACACDPASSGATATQQLGMTPFYVDAVANMFFEHAVAVPVTKDDKKSSEELVVMNRDGVANWITKSLGSEGKVSKHDKRVLAVVSKYSQYGSGVITGSGLLELYKDAALSGLNADGSLKRAPSGNSNPLDNVWRDLEAHGIASPIQQAWDEEMEAIRAIHAVDTKQNDDSNGNDEDMLLDECEILEWKKDSATPDWTVDSQAAGENQRKMSHEMVDLCKDGITPKSLRDGEFSKFVSRQPTVQYIVVFYDGTSFRQSLTHCCTVFSTAVFIDEESCIGCNQCAHIAPSSFIMLDTGRARTFSQRNTRDVDSAVSACPVACMKPVAFHELTELETARDKGDGRSDHRHMGGNIAHTPLHVALRGTDANHKSSWYHYLKSKCLMSNSCPKKGCYDCPFYSEPGANPYFKKRQEAAQEARLTHVMKTGEADKHRRFVDI
jgi:ferredoxin